MATSKGYTPPKGRATAGRDRHEGPGRRIPPMLEWIVLGIVILNAVVAAWVFSTGSDGTPHNGAPAGTVGSPLVVTTSR